MSQHQRDPGRHRRPRFRLSRKRPDRLLAVLEERHAREHERATRFLDLRTPDTLGIDTTTQPDTQPAEPVDEDEAANEAAIAQLEAEWAAREAAEQAEREAAEQAEWEDNWAAADAADAAAVADHAAVYGNASPGYEQARAEQAAAREVLPQLSEQTRDQITRWEAERGRYITLPELQYMQRHHTDTTEALDAAEAGDVDGDDRSTGQDLPDGYAEHLEREEDERVAAHEAAVGDGDDLDHEQTAAAQAATDRIMHAQVQQAAEAQAARMRSLSVLPDEARHQLLDDLERTAVGPGARADIQQLRAALDQLPTTSTTDATGSDAARSDSADSTGSEREQAQPPPARRTAGTPASPYDVRDEHGTHHLAAGHIATGYTAAGYDAHEVDDLDDGMAQ